MYERHNQDGYEILTPDEVARFDAQLDTWRMHATPAPPKRWRGFDLPPGFLLKAGAVAAALAVTGVGVWSATWPPAAAPAPAGPSAASRPTAVMPLASPTPTPTPTASPGSPRSTAQDRPAKAGREQIRPRRTARPRPTPPSPVVRAEHAAPHDHQPRHNSLDRPAKRPRKPAHDRPARRPPERSGPIPAMCADRFPQADVRYHACLSFLNSLTR